MMAKATGLESEYLAGLAADSAVIDLVETEVDSGVEIVEVSEVTVVATEEASVVIEVEVSVAIDQAALALTVQVARALVTVEIEEASEIVVIEAALEIAVIEAASVTVEIEGIAGASGETVAEASMLPRPLSDRPTFALCLRLALSPLTPLHPTDLQEPLR